MSFETRPARTEEMPEFRRVTATALIMKPSVFEWVRPEWTFCGFEDGKLATSFASIPLTMRFNGGGIPFSGVTCVGSLPQYRRRGHLRKIMCQHFEQLHEKGEKHIAVLWASLAAIYQRYGYAIVSTRHTYTVEPRYIQFAQPQRPSGNLREANEGGFELLSALYTRFIEDRIGYIQRPKGMWEYVVLVQPPAGHTLVRTVYEEGGEPLGYMIYVSWPQPGGSATGHHIGIRDLVWLTPSAYQALWENLATMDLMADINWQRAPADDPLPNLLLEPRKLNATAADELLARIVDVKALTQRRYQQEGMLTFELIDDVCPWNSNRWKLEATMEGSRIAATRQSAQVTLPASTLALLAFGQVSPTEASRMGRLDVLKPDVLPLWDNVMRTMYKPACVDMF